MRLPMSRLKIAHSGEPPVEGHSAGENDPTP
jgi:hypothetical protein